MPFLRLKCGEFLLLLIGHVNGRDTPPLATIHEDTRRLLGERSASLIWAASQFGSTLDPEQRLTALQIQARRVLESLDLYWMLNIIPVILGISHLLIWNYWQRMWVPFVFIFMCMFSLHSYHHSCFYIWLRFSLLKDVWFSSTAISDEEKNVSEFFSVLIYSVLLIQNKIYNYVFFFPGVDYPAHQERSISYINISIPFRLQIWNLHLLDSGGSFSIASKDFCYKSNCSSEC